MGTVKERFKAELKGKLKEEEMEAAMLATFPSLRWDSAEREYPEQFYEEKVPEVIEKGKELRAVERGTTAPAQARRETEVKGKTEAAKTEVTRRNQ